MNHISGRQWEPIELRFESAYSYQDPFNEARMDLIVRDDREGEWNVPCFWAGGAVWKARFSAPHTGLYHYETKCSNPQDAGLDGCTGEISVSEYDGDNPLYIHGPIEVMEDGRHFMHQDKTPFAWLGDTWWNVFSSRMNENGEVQFLAKDRADKGFTLVSLVSGFWCDLAPYDKRLANEAGFPWTEDYGTINPEYYNIADQKAAAIADAGLVMAIAATWGFYIRLMGVEKMKKHVRYMIARYAAYPVVWLTAGETPQPFYDDQRSPQEDVIVAEAKRDWTEVLKYMKKTDPYHRPATVHTRYDHISTDEVEDTELLDFIVYQAGVHDGDQKMVAEQVARLAKRGLEASPKRPVINAETCYEGMLYQCGPQLQRWLFWHAALDGCAGWTYGANGMFTASHEKDPFGTAYYGTNWGEQTWQEAVHFEGAKQVGAARKYLDKYEWWKLVPDPEITEDPEGKTEYEKTIAARIGDDLIMAYMQRNITLNDVTNYPYCMRFKNLTPGIYYQIKAYNPIRDYEISLWEAKVQEDGRLVTPALPVLQDWVVILKKEQN